MRHVAERTNVPLEELYTLIGWPLYRKYGHAYDAFKIAISYYLLLHLFHRPSVLMLDSRRVYLPI